MAKPIKTVARKTRTIIAFHFNHVQAAEIQLNDLFIRVI